MIHCVIQLTPCWACFFRLLLFALAILETEVMMFTISVPNTLMLYTDTKNDIRLIII